MSEMILSIVVPSYNVSKFVDSYISKFYVSELENRIEILFINDGSTDTTGEKLMRICSQHPNYFFLYNKENGGHGSVINIGFKIAQGKYVKIIDGDDEFDKNNIIEFVDFLSNSSADAVYSDYMEHYETTNDNLIRKVCYDKSDFLNYNICFHSVCYSRKFWNENAISVREKCFYEDTEYAIFPLRFVNKIDYFDKLIYIYNLGVKGQSMSYSSLVKHFEDHQLITNDLVLFYNNCKVDDINNKIREVILDFVRKTCLFHYMLIALHEDNDYKVKQELIDFMHYLKQVTDIYAFLKAQKIVRRYSFCHYLFLPIFRRISKKHYIKQNGI